MQVHRFRQLNVSDRTNAIKAIAIKGGGRPNKKTFAVARENGDIEFWREMACVHVIPGTRGLRLSSLVWIGDRLFSAGLNCPIAEWDLATLQADRTISAHGGAVECMSASPDGLMLAAGCEDGAVRVFAVRGPGEDIELVRLLDAGHGARVLSLSWHQDCKTIVSGAADGSVTRWDLTSGRPRLRVVVDSFGGDPPCIWTVAVLSDYSMITGDSNGNTQFFDGEFGTMVQGFKQHDADVLALVVDESERRVFTSGADAKVCMFVRVEGKAKKQDGDAAGDEGGGGAPGGGGLAPSSGTAAAGAGGAGGAAAGAAGIAGDGAVSEEGMVLRKWNYASSKRGHTHDVNALAISDDLLLSGGVDSLVLSYSVEAFASASPLRYPPFGLWPHVSVCPKRRLVVVQQANAVQVWQLAQEDATASAGHPALPEPAIHVATIEIADNDDHLVSSAISPDGGHVAVSTISEVRLYKLVVAVPRSGGGAGKEPIVAVTRDTRWGPEALPPASRIVFTPDSQRLVLASLLDQVVVVVALESRSVLRSLEVSRGAGAEDLRQPIVTLSVSPDGQWLFTGDLGNNMDVYNLDSLHFHATLPRSPSQHTAVAFHPSGSMLVVGCADNRFIIYDVEHKCVSDWTKRNLASLPPRLTQQPSKISGVLFDQSRPNTLFLWGRSFLCVVDLDEDAAHSAGSQSSQQPKSQAVAVAVAAEPKRKAKRKAGEDASSQPQIIQPHLEAASGPAEDKNFKIIRKYQEILMASMLAPGIMFIAEKPWVSVLSTLPDTIKRKKYGT